MSPGGLLSHRERASPLPAAAEDGLAESDVECVADAVDLVVLSGVKVGLVPPLQAAVPVKTAAAPSAHTDRRTPQRERVDLHSPTLQRPG